MRLSQAKLQQKIELLAGNGQRPEVRPVMSQVGYDPNALALIETEVESWIANRQQMKVLFGDQKAATLAQREARKAARIELVDLAKTIRILFGGDEPVLTMLGLLPQSSETAIKKGEPTVNSQNSDKATSTAAAKTVDKPAKSVKRRSESLAADIDRWRLLCANVGQLSRSRRARLAVAGWSAERVAAAAALVEALVEAHATQQVAVDLYLGHAALTGRQEKALRKWYSDASRLVKMALNRLASEQRTHFKAMLGL
jgi:hypothetical protein